MASNKHFPLLNLPAELRLRIWEYALAPTGVTYLTWGFRSSFIKDHGAIPITSPALLRTCKQIHAEAGDALYERNTVCFSVNVHDTCWPLIAERRLPQRVLERLQHVCLVLDASHSFHASYDDVDWTPFQALTSLKTLRITILKVVAMGSSTYVPDYTPDMSNAVPLIAKQLLERVPKTTKVYYGTQMDSYERDFIEIVCRRRKFRESKNLTVEEVGDTEWEDHVADIRSLDIDQGCNSGGVEDVFAEYREGYLYP